MRKYALLVIAAMSAGCGHETTPPGTFNGQQLTRIMTVTVNNTPAHDVPNIEIEVVGKFSQGEAAPLTIYSVKCGGKYDQIYLEGVGVFQCDADGAGIKSVEMRGAV